MLTQEPFYNKTTVKVMAGFLTMLNNVKIERHDGVVTKVPLRYGNRQKYLKYLDQTRDLGYDKPQIRRRLPFMAYEIIDFEYDSERQKSKLQPLRLQNLNDSDSVVKLFQPTPYNLTIELTIVARKESEVFQIFEQIVPYFQPEFVVNIKPIEGITNHVDDIPFKLLSATFQADKEDKETIDEREFIITFQCPVKYYSQVKSRKVIKIVELQDSLSETANVTSVEPLESSISDDWVVRTEVIDL